MNGRLFGDGVGDLGQDIGVVGEAEPFGWRYRTTSQLRAAVLTLG